ncbi:hypothetical protein L228DRAFT_238042 [Xylona heveae TC161]|uniref:Rhodopsin domain-containing protein n=1 Tax=Xylona heveae (strain CBS 132557 / TC161) TaxID=1328760 RepID=A0A165HGH5_XYLHT|nr:hypothetical protein L228DRAFT_238042 [Xylona heveae TC161]KZF23478.1 hypothetical protein L228DRAFT_238042 [Xylona heveae TC161]
MASGPPPGMDITEDFGPHVVAAVIALLVIATISVGLRFGTRFAAKQQLKWDDLLIVLALAFAFGTGILSILACHYGIGKHIYNPAVNIEKVLKVLWAYEFLYGAVIPSTKMSIIMFYHRIFPVKSVTITLSICAFLVIGWWIAIWVTAIVQCIPHSYFWEQYLNPMAKGRCINTYAFFLANGGLSVVTDFIILTVPLPMVWKLQMPTAQKLAVTGIFLLGGFVCIAGIVRLHFLSQMYVTPDFTWNMAQSFIWSCVEPCIGIVCACLPTLRPLLRTLFPRLFSRASGGKGSSGDTGGTGGTGKSNGATSGDRDNFVRLPGSGGNRRSRTKSLNLAGMSTTTDEYDERDDDVDNDGLGAATTTRIYAGSDSHSMSQGVEDNENKIPMHTISTKRDSIYR